MNNITTNYSYFEPFAARLELFDHNSVLSRVSCVPRLLFFQRSGWCLCAWAAGTRSTTSTSCGSPRTWSGTPPASNAPSATSTWTSRARASSGTGRLTVNGTTSGRTAGGGTGAGAARTLDHIHIYYLKYVTGACSLWVIVHRLMRRSV